MLLGGPTDKHPAVPDLARGASQAPVSGPDGDYHTASDGSAFILGGPPVTESDVKRYTNLVADLDAYRRSKRRPYDHARAGTNLIPDCDS